MTMEGDRTRETLELLGTSEALILVLLIGVTISYCAVERQRRQICLATRGEEQAAGCIGRSALELRRISSALVTGSLGIFFLLAGRSWTDAAENGDCAACCSAGRNLWASLLVFVAALIRLYDLAAQ